MPQANNPSTPSSIIRHPLPAAAVILVLLVLVAYAPTLSSEFVGLDDFQYVVDNQLVRSPSWSSVHRFFVEVRNPSSVAGYYQPLTMMSLMIDAWLTGGEGLDPFYYHLTSILLHAGTSVLVMLLLRGVVGGVAVPFLIAAVFALHPMQVESVAWISQRKTVLSTLLAVAGLLGYLRYGRMRRSGEAPRGRWLAASVLLYAASGLAKPTVLLLPVVLPLLDVYPLGRVPATAPQRRGITLLEKLPFLVCLLPLMWVSWVSQATSSAQLMSPNFSSLDVLTRLFGLICYNLILYLGNLVWPTMLSPYRDLPADPSLTQWPILLSVLATLFLIVACLTAYRRSKPLFVGGLAFGVLLAPALGAIRFVETCVADRFLYLPGVFLLLPLAAGLARLERRRPEVRWLARGGPVLLIAVLLILMRTQQGVWRDSLALWGRVVQTAPHFPSGLTQFASEELIHGHFQSAIEHARRALAIVPNEPGALHLLGRALVRTGQPEKAAESIRQAISGGLGPMEPMAYISLAEALIVAGDLAGARTACDQAIAMERDAAFTYTMLGDMALNYAKNGAVAAEYYRLALDCEPDNTAIRWNFGTALQYCGRDAEALAEYERVIATYRTRRRSVTELEAAAAPLRSRVKPATTAPSN